MTGTRTFGLTRGGHYLDGEREEFSRKESVWAFVTREGLQSARDIGIWLDALMDSASSTASKSSTKSKRSVAFRQ